MHPTGMQGTTDSPGKVLRSWKLPPSALHGGRVAVFIDREDLSAMLDRAFLTLTVLISTVFYGGNLAPEGDCDGCEAGYHISGFSSTYGGTFQAWLVADEKGECDFDDAGNCKQSKRCRSEVKYTYTPAQPYSAGQEYCFEDPGNTPPYSCVGPFFQVGQTSVTGTAWGEECGLSTWSTVWLKNGANTFTIGQVIVFCEYCLGEKKKKKD